jgi:hypothetical protein
MSAKQVSLKSPVTIAVVIILLGGVAYLNVNTFGGMNKKSSRGYRVQAHPSVPLDVGQLAVCEMGLPDSAHKKVSAFAVESLQRDPFFPGQGQPKPMVQPTTKRRKKSVTTRTRVKPLECTAIMLGGNQPMAIINGEGRYPGDKIRGLILTNIDADGVTFRQADGSFTHLAVGVQEDENQSFRVITRAQKREDLGRTRLVDQYQEGNPK